MTESVGNKRPPVRTRFRKGQSGNPRGRPRGALNLKTDLLSELAEVIVMTEGGTQRKITKQRAFVKATIAKAIKGDGRAATALISMIARLVPHEAQEPERTPLAEDDETLIAAFLKRHAK